jgi:anti-sigma regulatory factor (Ser/Thr protein kinase)
LDFVNLLTPSVHQDVRRVTPVRRDSFHAVENQSWQMAAVRLAPGQARDSIRDFVTLLELPEKRLDDVLLCVSEAVTNVVMHAYRRQEEPGTVEVDARVEDHSLVIVVRDSGGGMTPRFDSPGPGLGIPIIAALARSSEFRSPEGGGAEIVMRFSLS